MSSLCLQVQKLYNLKDNFLTPQLFYWTSFCKLLPLLLAATDNFWLLESWGWQDWLFSMHKGSFIWWRIWWMYFFNQSLHSFHCVSCSTVSKTCQYQSVGYPLFSYSLVAFMKSFWWVVGISQISSALLARNMKLKIFRISESFWNLWKFHLGKCRQFFAYFVWKVVLSRVCWDMLGC